MIVVAIVVIIVVIVVTIVVIIVVVIDLVVVALGAMKRQIQLPSLSWICLVTRLVYPTLILNI